MHIADVYQFKMLVVFFFLHFHTFRERQLIDFMYKTPPHTMPALTTSRHFFYLAHFPMMISLLINC